MSCESPYEDDGFDEDEEVEVEVEEEEEPVADTANNSCGHFASNIVISLAVSPPRTSSQASSTLAPDKPCKASSSTGSGGGGHQPGLAPTSCAVQDDDGYQGDGFEDDDKEVANATTDSRLQGHDDYNNNQHKTNPEIEEVVHISSRSGGGNVAAVAVPSSTPPAPVTTTTTKANRPTSASRCGVRRSLNPEPHCHGYPNEPLGNEDTLVKKHGVASFDVDKAMRRLNRVWRRRQQVG